MLSGVKGKLRQEGQVVMVVVRKGVNGDDKEWRERMYIEWRKKYLSSR